MPAAERRTPAQQALKTHATKRAATKKSARDVGPMAEALIPVIDVGAFVKSGDDAEACEAVARALHACG